MDEDLSHGNHHLYLESIQPRVYLSGPMDRVSKKEGQGWREQAKTLLAEHEIQAVDPYDFEENVNDPKLLVKRDLHWVLRSEGMIINASQDVVTWGTPMETFWAHIHKVINVAFVEEHPPSLWLSAHARIVPTLDQAVEVIAWEIRQL